MAFADNSRQKILRLLPVFFFLGAFFIRIYDLGRESFWCDEAYQASVAASPSLTALVAGVRDHIVAMPLDYLVSWLVGRFTLDEGWLRLPSVIWGSLAVVVAYFLFRKLAKMSVAISATVFLVLSPLLVYYSQEARFYASLLFFYLLETLLILRAINNPRRLNWLLLAVTSIVGSYFQVYTLLAFVNGFAWILISRSQLSAFRKIFVEFLFTGLVVFLVFLPGFLFFCIYTGANWIVPIQDFLFMPLRGLGWFTLFDSSPGYLLGLVSLCLGILGVVVSFVRKQYLFVALAVSLLDQIAIVLVLDIVRHYFVAARQFIFLLPFGMLLTIAGLVSLSEWFSAFSSRFIKVKPLRKNLAYGIFSVSCLILVALSISTLANDFKSTKSNGREVSQALQQLWSPGEVIWVVPNYETKIYQFYFEYRLNSPQLVKSLVGANWDQLEQITPDERTAYLVTSGCDQNYLNVIHKLGFSPYSNFSCQDSAHILWVKQ